LIRNYHEDLAVGDCIYIPAYYFYSIKADAIVQELQGNVKPSAIMVTLNYEPHNKLLGAFFEAIESGELQ